MTADDLEPALYAGRVMHKRLTPFTHRFSYRVFSLWLDLDRLEETASRLRLFSHNRFNLLSFHDRDHGPRDGTPVRDWLHVLLSDWKLLPAAPRIMAQCYPRLLGHVFNPISVYYVYETAAEPARLTSIVYEVKNTFGDQHCYVIPVRQEQQHAALITQQADKGLYVSPFLPLAGHYRFRLNRPGQYLSQLIRQSGAAGEQLVATFTAERQALTDRNILRMVAQHPLMTLKVVAGIHWEALKLWRKGASFHHRPPAPAAPATLTGE
jgi:uncharacterized protein